MHHESVYSGSWEGTELKSWEALSLPQHRKKIDGEEIPPRLALLLGGGELVYELPGELMVTRPVPPVEVPKKSFWQLLLGY